MSNVSSVDELHRHHQVLELTLPLPTQPLVWVMSSGLTTIMPATPTKGPTMLLSHIRSDNGWGVRRKRGTSSTHSEVIGGLFLFLFLFFGQFSNYRSIEQPNHNHTITLTALHIQKPSYPLFGTKHQHHCHIPFTPNGTSSAGDIQHTCTGFFELSMALAAQALLPYV